MTTLITLLISLLGYGTPADYADYSEDQLHTEIEMAQQNEENNEADGGLGHGWEI